MLADLGKTLKPLLCTFCYSFQNTFLETRSRCTPGGIIKSNRFRQCNTITISLTAIGRHLSSPANGSEPSFRTLPVIGSMKSKDFFAAAQNDTGGAAT